MPTPKGLHPTLRVHILARQAEPGVCTLGLAHGKGLTHCVLPANRSVQHTQPQRQSQQAGFAAARFRRVLDAEDLCSTSKLALARVRSRRLFGHRRTDDRICDPATTGARRKKERIATERNVRDLPKSSTSKLGGARARGGHTARRTKRAAATNGRRLRRHCVCRSGQQAGKSGVCPRPTSVPSKLESEFCLDDGVSFVRRATKHSSGDSTLHPEAPRCRTSRQLRASGLYSTPASRRRVLT